MTRGFNTRAVQEGEVKDKQVGNVITPIFENSTFITPNEASGAAVDHSTGKPFLYTRVGNPTLEALERKYAALDMVDSALSFSSGMAAISTTMLSMLKTGDRLLSVSDLYGETLTLFKKTLKSFGIETDFVSLDNLNKANLDFRKYRAVFTESILNPTMGVSDIRSLGKVLLETETPLIVDATFASPFNQNPTKLGASISVHSGTKYIGGHSDIILGLAGFSSGYMKEMSAMRKNLGGVPDPIQAFLGLRGIKTLGLRMKAHNENAMKIASFLEQHQQVVKVNYPGLESSRYHEIAERNLTGFGGMISFELKGGISGARRMMSRMTLGAMAPSLGGVETLVTLPSDTSHASLSPEDRKAVGISEGLIRLSVGIEEAEDLIEDFQMALS